MIKYAKVVNKETGLCEVGLGRNISFYQSIGMTQLDVAQSDIDNNWYLTELCPMKTDEQKELEEKERIAHLSLTRGDVFRGLLLARGVTRLMLRGMIETNEQLTEVQKEMALIDFDEALNFYRGNALIDTVGLALGIEPAQLDCFFQTNDYTCLLPKVEPEEPPVEEDLLVENEPELPTDEIVEQEGNTEVEE